MAEAWIKFIIAWGPLALILGGFIYFSARASRKYYTKYDGYIDRVNDINERILAYNQEMIGELRSMTSELRQLKEVMKSRK